MSPKERVAVMTTVGGLLMIAKIAMPDTYFASDTRIQRAHRLMVRLKNKQTARLNSPRKPPRGAGR